MDLAVPSSIFNYSVLKAVKGWRYKPRMEEGAPVATFKARNRVRFTLER